MDQSQIWFIMIIFIFYLLLIIFILMGINPGNNIYIITVDYIIILVILALLLVFLYIEVNNAQFPTIATKKLNSEEVLNTVLIHNILINKGLKSEYLEKSKTEFINLCIEHKFSLEEDKIMHIFDTITNLNEEKLNDKT